MEAKDLRIGNLIKRNNEVFGVWNLKRKSLELDSVELDRHVKYETYENIMPLDLSEEWLLKFGFEGNNMDMWKVLPFGDGVELHVDCVQEGKFVNAVLTKGRVEKGIPGRDYVYIYLSECQYVHQLQNLFFAITGEELEVKHERSTCG